MSDKFRDLYRIPTARLQNWDYGADAIYFVTICTDHHQCFFGEIVNGEMVLSDLGKIAQQFWNEIPNHFPFVVLGEYVVMPNHIHGVIIFDKPFNWNEMGVVETPKLNTITETPKLGVSTLPASNNETADHNCQRTDNASKKWKPDTLGVVINQYKRMVTIHARQIVPDFRWQSRFYDHIVRDDRSFLRITSYIEQNPSKWAADKFSNDTEPY